MTYSELIERVGWGEEFSFYYQKEKYWISQNAEGHYLTRVRDSATQAFKTTEELFKKGKIDNKSLLDIWDDIKDSF